MKQQKIIRTHSKKAVEQPLIQSFTDRKKSLSLRQIKNSYSLHQGKQENLHHSKVEIAKKISKQLLGKLQMDLEARDAIEIYNIEKIKRLAAIENEIETINRENAVRIDELTRLEKTFIKKIEKDIDVDKHQQQRLRKQYEKLMKEQEKIAITKGVKQIQEKQDWLSIEKQQRRLELMVKVLENRHLVMGRDKSIEFLKQRKKKEQEEVEKTPNYSKSPKKERKKKNAQELKEMGRQFLEHAKKVQAQNLKNNTKILDVYQKSIDYLPQIKMILKNNTGNLSKPLQNSQQVHRSKRKKVAGAKTAR